MDEKKINPEWVSKRYPHLVQDDTFNEQRWICTVCNSRFGTRVFTPLRLNREAREQYVCDKIRHERAAFWKAYQVWLATIGYKVTPGFYYRGQLKIRLTCPKGHKFRTSLNDMGRDTQSYRRCLKCKDVFEEKKEEKSS